MHSQEKTLTPHEKQTNKDENNHKTSPAPAIRICGSTYVPASTVRTVNGRGTCVRTYTAVNRCMEGLLRRRLQLHWCCPQCGLGLEAALHGRFGLQVDDGLANPVSFPTPADDSGPKRFWGIRAMKMVSCRLPCGDARAYRTEHGLPTRPLATAKATCVTSVSLSNHGSAMAQRLQRCRRAA